MHEKGLVAMLGLGIIGWIIIGGLAGWIGSKIMGTDAQQGILLNIVVGIIGGLLGGFLLNLLGVDVEGGGLIFSFLTCLLGAVILLFLVKAVTGRGVRR
ncbi:GlsB/YeaQ/YmgE family stress response membrane protein [Rhodococcus sp. HNM0563]|nr:GlsB/YeaQ/YmgE family stress response membrane protein [Rhodococcus sp. HNM0563]